MIVLHAGCGRREDAGLPVRFDGWQEIRLDIDPIVKPDIVGSLTCLPVESASVDAAFTAHTLEHLYPHEVPQALAEFRRVLKVGGFVLVNVPDLKQAAALVALDKGEETAYETQAFGPITAMDIVFGHRDSTAKGNHWMAHKTGFTERTLAARLSEAGFAEVRVQPHGMDLWAEAWKR